MIRKSTLINLGLLLSLIIFVGFTITNAPKNGDLKNYKKITFQNIYTLRSFVASEIVIVKSKIPYVIYNGPNADSIICSNGNLDLRYTEESIYKNNDFYYSTNYIVGLDQLPSLDLKNGRFNLDSFNQSSLSVYFQLGELILNDCTFDTLEIDGYLAKLKLIGTSKIGCLKVKNDMYLTLDIGDDSKIDGIIGRELSPENVNITSKYASIPKWKLD